MNNQQKSDENTKNVSTHLSDGEPVKDGHPVKRKRGRPKTSPHDTATQNRIRVQRHRQAMKDEEAVRVDIYLPKAWHDWLVNVKDANLREVGVEAFALWLKNQGYPVEAVERWNASDET